jgi:putative transcriptional regulator
MVAEQMRAKRPQQNMTVNILFKLSHAEFANHVPFGTLRDLEQARVIPHDFAVAYVRVIAQPPSRRRL